MDSAAPVDVLVVGAGVSGLTSALCLADTGLTVRVLTHQPPLRTTSAVAGAIWGPYVVDDSRVPDWSMRTLSALERIAGDDGSGVRLVCGLEASREPARPPFWAPHLRDFALCEPAELPAGFMTGWRYSVPVLDMPVYLDYLCQRLDDLGVRVELLPAPLVTLEAVAGLARTVVNCTGLASRHLVSDPEIFPVWGQLVVTENPGITGFFSDYPESGEPTYFISHKDYVVLGGIVTPHREDADPDPNVANRIVARCARVEPRLTRARILGHRVGLRPSRPRVRLERALHGDFPVIHNYGHGGSGVTLSWGCAMDVVTLIG